MDRASAGVETDTNTQRVRYRRIEYLIRQDARARPTDTPRNITTRIKETRRPRSLLRFNIIDVFG